MDYELAGAIAGIVLALLFVIYARNKLRGPRKKRVNEEEWRNPYEQKAETEPAKPDAVSKAAAGIYRAHQFYNKIMALVIVGVVLGMAFFDPLVRIIVVSTLIVLLLLLLILRLRRRR